MQLYNVFTPFVARGKQTNSQMKTPGRASSLRVTLCMDYFLSDPFPKQSGPCPRPEAEVVLKGQVLGQAVMKIQFCVELIKSSLKIASTFQSRHLGISTSAVSIKCGPHLGAGFHFSSQQQFPALCFMPQGLP